jgi:hypothetical protein
MDYNILNAVNFHSLVHIVKDAIKEGWIPQGGVSKGVGDECYQAMIKKK